MEFTTRVVKNSNPTLSQEEALTSLYSHPEFKTGSRVKSIKRRGQYWVAEIDEPKTAAGPPFEDDGEESGPPAPKEEESSFPPKDEHDEGEEIDTEDKPEGESEEGGDFPPKKDKGEKGEKGGEKVELQELLHLVHQIADVLGISKDEGLLGPEGLAEGPPAPPPGPPGAHGAPPGPPGKGPVPGGGAPVPKPGRPLRPGEVPPGGTPVGSPAFASQRRSGVCPHCGGPQGIDGTCPTCAQSYNQPQTGTAPTPPPMGGAISPIGRAASITAANVTDMPIKEAKVELEKLYGPHGYKVKQIKRSKNAQGQNEIRALLSVR